MKLINKTWAIEKKQKNVLVQLSKKYKTNPQIYAN